MYGVGYSRARASVYSVKLDGSDCYNYKHSSVACSAAGTTPRRRNSARTESGPRFRATHYVRPVAGCAEGTAVVGSNAGGGVGGAMLFSRAVRAALFFGAAAAVAFSATAHARRRSCTGGYTLHGSPPVHVPVPVLGNGEWQNDRRNVRPKFWFSPISAQ